MSSRAQCTCRTRPATFVQAVSGIVNQTVKLANVKGAVVVLAGVLVPIAACVAFRDYVAHRPLPAIAIICAASWVGLGTFLVLAWLAARRFKQVGPILHLQDVYWTPEGQLSVQLVALALSGMGLVLLGLNPLTSNSGLGAGHLAVAASTAVDTAAILICVRKGKYSTGVLGVFLPPGGLDRRGPPGPARVDLGTPPLRDSAGCSGEGEGRRLRCPVRPLGSDHRRSRGRPPVITEPGIAHGESPGSPLTRRPHRTRLDELADPATAGRIAADISTPRFRGRSRYVLCGSRDAGPPWNS